MREFLLPWVFLHLREFEGSRSWVLGFSLEVMSISFDLGILAWQLAGEQNISTG